MIYNNECIFYLRSGAPEGQPPRDMQSKRMQQTQAQVDEVVDIMRVNVDKVLERDQKISELDDRADALQAGASQFEASAGKLKRKYWWKNCKMMIILGSIIAVIIIIIIGKFKISVYAPSMLICFIVECIVLLCSVVILCCSIVLYPPTL
ncbi:hypothetical protein SNE40_013972 [Patella caerulea]|uniref:V-SNARE coiled-coil homology domain-containing protein n=1 Tax=Patella caerulea TaxID=87958 RepID=A0AAN8JG45_PATCE